MSPQMIEQKEKSRYKLGLSLSGGGAKGFAHLGVIKAMDELGIRPNIISGTSAGALAGALYADGNKPDDILSFFQNKGFKEFAELTIPQTGIFKTDRFKEFLKRHLKSKTFDELKIPLKIIATDIVEGKSVILEKGSLIQAIIASCAYPIVFTPAQIDGVHYIDGGLFENFPVRTIRNLCDTIVGVNVSPLTKQKYKNSLLYIAERSFHYISVSNTLLDRTLCDILIETNRLSDFAMFSLDHATEIFDIGYEIGLKKLKESQTNGHLTNLVNRDSLNTIERKEQH